MRVLAAPPTTPQAVGQVYNWLASKPVRSEGSCVSQPAGRRDSEPFNWLQVRLVGPQASRAEPSIRDANMLVYY